MIATAGNPLGLRKCTSLFTRERSFMNGPPETRGMEEACSCNASCLKATREDEEFAASLGNMAAYC